MANQYYNPNVNSMQIVPPELRMTEPHTVYRPPSTFKQQPMDEYVPQQQQYGNGP
jgi:hypothetical protein